MESKKRSMTLLIRRAIYHKAELSVKKFSFKNLRRIPPGKYTESKTTVVMEEMKKAENLTIPLRVFRYIAQHVIGRRTMTALIKKSLKSDYPRPEASVFRPIYGYATTISKAFKR
ncbi:MAG: hypothetical protein GWP07_06900, partial [Xanthomonadaceae bacterium]|nr:hypothetical protein [Xanthomonadaceae bacterium]